jgi:hypothetical protein
MPRTALPAALRPHRSTARLGQSDRRAESETAAENPIVRNRLSGYPEQDDVLGSDARQLKVLNVAQMSSGLTDPPLS